MDIRHSIHIVNDSDSMEVEWDDQRGIVAMRRYGVLGNEADDAVMESKQTLGARGPGNQQKHLEYIVGSG